MIEAGLTWIPGGIAPLDAVLLLGAAAIGAFITTVAGIGGGVFLLAVMTPLVPVSVLIPMHGAVQAAANGWRALLFVRSIHWAVVAAFAAGCAAGAVAAAPLVARVPSAWLELALAVFILYAIWAPTMRTVRGSRAATATGGFITGGLTLFVGATGPLVAALIRGCGFDRFPHVATFSACMLLQHGFKLAVFVALGFAFGEHLPLLVGMMVCSLMGTLCARPVLGRLNDRLFHRLLGVLLSLLALRLAVSGMTGVMTTT